MVLSLTILGAKRMASFLFYLISGLVTVTNVRLELARLAAAVRATRFAPTLVRVAAILIAL